MDDESASDDARRLAETRASWDVATRAHNAHKRDQAAFLRGGGSTLFSEEVALVGDLAGRRLLHTLCNSGQDTLSLAARGARCVGVDLSDEAIAFARALSEESGIPAAFHRAEIQDFLAGPLEPEPFDVVFGSYGCLPWIADLPRFFRGVAARLSPGGRFACVEFHPLAWSFDATFQLRDPYFAPGRAFSEPVSDYVGASGGALSPSGYVESAGGEYDNPHVAHAWQATVADIVTAVLEAGLTLTTLREWPYANGCRIHAGLVALPDDPTRFTTPAHVPSLPLMLGLVATKR